VAKEVNHSKRLFACSKGGTAFDEGENHGKDSPKGKGEGPLNEPCKHGGKKVRFLPGVTICHKGGERSGEYHRRGCRIQGRGKVPRGDHPFATWGRRGGGGKGNLSESHRREACPPLTGCFPVEKEEFSSEPGQNQRGKIGGLRKVSWKKVFRGSPGKRGRGRKRGTR